MKKLTIAIAMFALSACLMGAGCQNMMPKPNSPQTAVYEARAQLGIQETLIDKYYLRTPDCTSPLTVLPCKSFTVAEAIQAGIRAAHGAVDAADKAVNNPEFDKGTAEAIVASAEEAVKWLTTLQKDPAYSKTAGKPAAGEVEALSKKFHANASG